MVSTILEPQNRPTMANTTPTRTGRQTRVQVSSKAKVNRDRVLVASKGSRARASREPGARVSKALKMVLRVDRAPVHKLVLLAARGMALRQNPLAAKGMALRKVPLVVRGPVLKLVLIADRVPILKDRANKVNRVRASPAQGRLDPQAKANKGPKLGLMDRVSKVLPPRVRVNRVNKLVLPDKANKHSNHSNSPRMPLTPSRTRRAVNSSKRRQTAMPTRRAISKAKKAKMSQRTWQL